MSEVGRIFCKDVLDALSKATLSILVGDTSAELFPACVLKHGLDGHEFVIGELRLMDEDERTDSEQFRIRRLAGKRRR